MEKKREILAVSFGTSYEETREKTIGAIERHIAEQFPEIPVHRCFTSRMIRKKLKERDGLHVDSPEEAIADARARGIRRLLVQPLYLMHGREHEGVAAILEKLEEGCFDEVSFGNPLLTDEEDLAAMARAIRRHLPLRRDPQETAGERLEDTAGGRLESGMAEEKLEGTAENGTAEEKLEGTAENGTAGEKLEGTAENGMAEEKLEGTAEDGTAGGMLKGAADSATAVVLMGHGTPPGASGEASPNEIYHRLQDKLLASGDPDYFIATVEGTPQLEDVLSVLCGRRGQDGKRRYRRILLAPLMIVAGDHAVNDLAGEKEDSWKNIFLKQGFRVDTVLQGIGEWEEVQALFADHVRAAMGRAGAE